jgi:hypothetical protein
MDSGVAGLELMEFHARCSARGAWKASCALPSAPRRVNASQPLRGGSGLPVLLLVPLFFFLLRSQAGPAGPQRPPRNPRHRHPGEASARDVVSRFALFLDAAESRIRELESTRNDSETSVKLLGYKRKKSRAPWKPCPKASSSSMRRRRGVRQCQGRPLLGTDPAGLLQKEPANWAIAPEILGVLASLLGSQPGPPSTPPATIRRPMRTAGSACGPCPCSPPRRHAPPRHPAGPAGNHRPVAGRPRRDEFIAHVAHELKTPWPTSACTANCCGTNRICPTRPASKRSTPSATRPSGPPP